MENLDRALLYLINTLGSTRWLDIFFPAITDLHKSPYFAMLVIPFFLGLFFWQHKKKGLWIFLGLILCLGVADFSGNQIKKNVQRSRPGDTAGVEVIVRSPYGGYSFASNHATNLFALATYSSYFVPQLTWPTFVLASLIAYSRVYNGVHYPSDVLFGAFLGVLIGYLGCFCMKRFFRWKEGRWS